MKKIIFLLFLAVSCELFSCTSPQSPQAVRLDRLFEERDFRFFELLEDEKIVTTDISLRKGQTKIFWRSNLQREFVFMVNEACELKQCGKDNCIVVSTATGNAIGFAFLLPDEVDDADKKHAFFVQLPWKEYHLQKAVEPLVYE